MHGSTWELGVFVDSQSPASATSLGSVPLTWTATFFRVFLHCLCQFVTTETLFGCLVKEENRYSHLYPIPLIKCIISFPLFRYLFLNNDLCNKDLYNKKNVVVNDQVSMKCYLPICICDVKSNKY